MIGAEAIGGWILGSSESILSLDVNSRWRSTLVLSTHLNTDVITPRIRVDSRENREISTTQNVRYQLRIMRPTQL